MPSIKGCETPNPQVTRSMNTTVTSFKNRDCTKQQPAKPLGNLCFIETQFPVSKMSKESYKERKSNVGQTLTGLGKWWGRKPLVLCRATILGLLLPATDDPERDREVFLRLMTMDDEGLQRRKSSSIPTVGLFRRLPPADRERYFEPDSTAEKARLKRNLPAAEKDALQRRVFMTLSYEERLEYCSRPEQVNGPSQQSWTFINAHLGTRASSLSELVAELGRQRFAHVPRVGDSFCGGGSIPFEAARIGCEAYGSDLSPVAALLTWASLNIVGGGEKIVHEVQRAQREVYEAVDREFIGLGIEHRDPDSATGRRWRADAYLYCTEVTCPECGWRVPLAYTWAIGYGTHTVARLIPDPSAKRFDFVIESDVSDEQLAAAEEAGTVKDSDLRCPNSHCMRRTPIKVLRGDGRGNFGDSKSRLRAWENEDLIPRRGDIFGERLYCIRWVDTWTDVGPNGGIHTCRKRYYRAPTATDLQREHDVLTTLTSRFDDWQKQGFIPSRRIEPGAKTDEPIRTRGWTHWHHLFNPRQLLVLGALCKAIATTALSPEQRLGCLLGVFKCADYNSRLSPWSPTVGKELVNQVFANQALNTLFNPGTRAFTALDTSWFYTVRIAPVVGKSVVEACDGRSVEANCDIWLTDPPYADAISYDEISEFFLAWATGVLRIVFPSWPIDSRRALAVKGSSESFKAAMVACYRSLASRMKKNDLQVVMFTHQDAGVWADLTLILWVAGLRVTSAWCVATETDAVRKVGNYVQGTVLLVLRKQTSEERCFLDEVYQDVEIEVRRQLDSMHDLDDARDPNFADTDYQLAAYAAALRVLTAKKIEEIDVTYELTRTRDRGEKSPVEDLIERAVKIACDHLVPKGIDAHLWKSLAALERLYLKGLEIESHGEYRSGVYQELARGFGVEEYASLLASTNANETRLKTASEFGRKELGDNGFGATLVRHALFAAHKTAETENARDGITWLVTEVLNYGANRRRIIEILEFLAALRQNASLPHWHRDAEGAAVLAGALRNRQDNV